MTFQKATSRPRAKTLAKQLRSTSTAQVLSALTLALAIDACGGSSETGGSGGAAGSGASGGSAGSAGGGTAGASGGAACNPACGEARTCCNGACANTANDPLNCGACGTECASGTYCTGGQCVTPPCSTACNAGATCCTSECCGAGQLCCDPQGPIDTEPHCTAPSDQGTCPMGCAPLCICASPDTPIATPSGDRKIASLEVGDLVYSVNGAAIEVVPIAAIHRTPVAGHRVVRARFANGTVLEISPGHPTADGRTFADLRAGAELDHVGVEAVDVVPYAHPYTYDILPASDTGTYFAGGLLIGSTLKERGR